MWHYFLVAKTGLNQLSSLLLFLPVLEQKRLTMSQRAVFKPALTMKSALLCWGLCVFAELQSLNAFSTAACQQSYFLLEKSVRVRKT